MKFKPEKIDDFLKIFHEMRHHIESFEGCQHLELIQSGKNKNWFMTFSNWENEAALEKYRDSELFSNIWGKVKQFFCEKAQAISIFNEATEEEERKRVFLEKFEKQ